MPNVQYVTLEIVNTLLQNQAESYRSSFQSMFADVKEEIRSIKKDMSDLKVSLQYTQSKFDDNEIELNEIELKVNRQQDDLRALNGHADGAEGQLVYLENQIWRSNIRIVGLQEDKYEKSWDNTEQRVKQVIKDKLGLTEDFEIDRCHRIGRSRNRQRRNGSQEDGPRPIVAKLVKWKDNECILKKAREVKPDGVKFLPDLSKCTLDKR